METGERFDERAAQLAIWARQIGCFELALAYEEVRYLGKGGRLFRGNFDERREELERFYRAFREGRFE